MPQSPPPPDLPPGYALGDRVRVTVEGTITALYAPAAAPLTTPRYLVEVLGRGGFVELPVHDESQLSPAPASPAVSP